MKYYKLLKDIPMFKKGDLFFIHPEEGCLLQKDTLRLAYHKKTLEKNPEILKEWFEEIEESENKRWRAKKYERYYYISDSGPIGDAIEWGSTYDNNRFNMGNYFKYHEEAEAHRGYLIAHQILLDDAEGGKFIQGEENWGNFYGTIYDRWGTLDDSIIHPGAIYFITREACRKSFEEHREQWEIVRKYEIGEM